MGLTVWRLTLNNQKFAPYHNIDKLFATLGRGKAFSKLDLNYSYQQLRLAEESKDGSAMFGRTFLQPALVDSVHQKQAK